MFENEQDANQMDSSPIETTQDANQTESQVAESSAADTTQPSPSQQQDANKGAELGNALPPKDNLVGEIRRKILEDLGPLVQGSVREAMLGFQTQQSVAPKSEEIKYQGKYGTAELERILNHPEATDADKHFANRGLAYIEARQDTLRDIDTRREKEVSQSRQTQALQSIVKDYPQVFNRQTNQWNFADPLWQKTMQIYNNDPRLQSFGNEGLRVAMDSAYSAMAREGQVTLKKKEVVLNSKQRAIDKNQSQAMTAGTLSPGKQTEGNTSKAKIMDTWKKNPDSEDAKRAALLKLVPPQWYT